MFAHPQVHHGLDQPMQGNRWQPIKPNKLRRRKRSFQMFQESSRAEMEANRAKTAPVLTSNPDHPAHNNIDLELITTSTKRRRTNQMQTAKDQIPALAQPALERDLFSHRPGQQRNRTVQVQTDSQTQSHSHSHSRAPKRARSEHSESVEAPPAKKRKIDNGLDALLRDQHKERSPEKLFERMNLNGFEIRNRENEAVAEWKHSIEAQLKEVRNGPAEVRELCRRIQEARGLGRAVLVAKLRQRVGEEVFGSVVQRLGLDLDSN